MSDDIVDRLRIWAKGVEQQRAVVLAAAITEAADEIERLREQLRLANIDSFNTIADAERLRAERDEARREICKRISQTIWGPQFPLMTEQQYAEERGWDCFKENTDE